MADSVSKEVRSRIMSAIRSRGNKGTELALAALFRASRVTGWRRQGKGLGRPDFVFARARVVVFVDGCFWHGCPKHGRMPRSNRKFWVAKIGRNKERDWATRRELRARGWRVVRVWEHELKTRPGAAVGRVARAILAGNTDAPPKLAGRSRRHAIIVQQI